MQRRAQCRAARHLTDPTRTASAIMCMRKMTTEETQMCRNIHALFNFDPPATAEEIHDAALQYVRKVSGSTKPSKANEQAFDRAVEAISSATAQLIEELVTAAPPKDREREAARARERAERRFGTVTG
jgi:hypothetical protein